MNFISESIGVLDFMFLRNEELIKYANSRSEWRAGTASTLVKKDVRVTDVLDLDPTRDSLEKELHDELIQTFTAAINEYRKKFKHLNISVGEQLRIIRYNPNGFYNEHIDTEKDRKVSIILYLNEDFEGGILNFPIQSYDIEPKSGRLVIFPSNYTHPHSSSKIESGIKYAVVSWFK